VSADAVLPPLGYFGSKVRVAPRIIDLLPAHCGYIEPYCGSLSVLLAKPPTGFEVVNDKDQDLMAFWRVLRDRPRDLARVCRLTPHSRAEYEASWPIPPGADDLERARCVWVKLTQGRGGALRATGWRYHEAPGGRTSTMPRTLAGYAARIEQVAARLAAVTLECRPALEVVDRYGRDPKSLLYVDPPYLHGTRVGGVYRHEMTDADHQQLLAALAAARSAVVVSGYAHDLYETALAGWERAELRAGTGQAVGKGWQDRTEVLWSNRPMRRDQPLWEPA
jgi:DNA adenine methylase